MSAGGLANSDVKPLEADIVAFLVKLFLGDDVAVELRVSAELGPSVPSVSHRTAQSTSLLSKSTTEGRVVWKGKFKNRSQYEFGNIIGNHGAKYYTYK